MRGSSLLRSGTPGNQTISIDDFFNTLAPFRCATLRSAPSRLAPVRSVPSRWASRNVAPARRAPLRLAPSKCTAAASLCCAEGGRRTQKSSEPKRFASGRPRKSARRRSAPRRSSLPPFIGLVTSHSTSARTSLTPRKGYTLRLGSGLMACWPLEQICKRLDRRAAPDDASDSVDSLPGSLSLLRFALKARPTLPDQRCSSSDCVEGMKYAQTGYFCCRSALWARRRTAPVSVCR